MTVLSASRSVDEKHHGFSLSVPLSNPPIGLSRYMFGFHFFQRREDLLEERGRLFQTPDWGTAGNLPASHKIGQSTVTIIGSIAGRLEWPTSMYRIFPPKN